MPAARPAALTERQLDEAQRIYDSGDHTVEEITDMFKVGGATIYRHLSTYQDGSDCVFVVYRNTRMPKIDPDTNQRYGETGADESVQLEADRKWWPIGRDREARVRAVVDGVATRVRGVLPDGNLKRDDRKYADIPLTAP